MLSETNRTTHSSSWPGGQCCAAGSTKHPSLWRTQLTYVSEYAGEDRMDTRTPTHPLLRATRASAWRTQTFRATGDDISAYANGYSKRT
jgi:hypothetical protein